MSEETLKRERKGRKPKHATRRGGNLDGCATVEKGEVVPANSHKLITSPKSYIMPWHRDAG